MRIGIDLVPIERITHSVSLISAMLAPSEYEDISHQSIAGKVAVKEALVKVGIIKPGQWLDVVILSEDSGKPYVTDRYGKRIRGIEISVSHTHDLAVAVVVYDK